jgi:hypothetical protein
MPFTFNQIGGFMKMLLRIVSAMLVLASLRSASWADQLVLTNGDRVTGSIVKKDGKNITIKSDSFGVITAAWDQVVEVKTEAPLTVVLQDGKSVQGALATTDGKITVATKDATLSVMPADVATARNADEQKAYERMVHPGWGDLWAGGASLGLAGAAGNAKTQTFTTNFNAARATNHDKTSLYFNVIRASALVDGVNSATARAVRGGLSYDHNVSSRLFLSSFNDYEYDKFQNLDLRFVLGGGFGFHAIKKERTRLDLLAGGDYDHESFSTPLTRSNAEAYWGDDYNFKLSGATSISQSFRMFNNLTNTGTYRMNADLGANTKLRKSLTWNLSLSDRFLSDPAAGRKRNDVLYTTGIGWTFAK